MAGLGIAHFGKGRFSIKDVRQKADDVQDALSISAPVHGPDFT
jgi:hypothetical protein